MILGKIYLWIMRRLYQRHSQYAYTGKIALCCIGKMENRYIREFIEYYRIKCFDKIFLYDNNDDDGEHFEDVIFDYVGSKFVDIIDYRGRRMCQCDAYQDCYEKHGKEYDWIAFFDCDEFLTFVDDTENIHSFLSRSKFIDFQLIHINWMVYGDNEMMDDDGRPVLERFVNPKRPFSFMKSLPFPENNHVKSIVRGGLGDIHWKGTSHTPITRYYACCNAKGEKVEGNVPFHDFDHDVAYLRHYSTKTIGEWIRVKMRRGFPDQTEKRMMENVQLDKFFLVNLRTKEKEQYAVNLMKELLA